MDFGGGDSRFLSRRPADHWLGYSAGVNMTSLELSPRKSRIRNPVYPPAFLFGVRTILDHLSLYPLYNRLSLHNPRSSQPTSTFLLRLPTGQPPQARLSGERRFAATSAPLSRFESALSMASRSWRFACGIRDARGEREETRQETWSFERQVVFTESSLNLFIFWKRQNNYSY